MAARRLLILMLILLGISSVIAIALPKPDRDDPTSQESQTTGETGTTGETAIAGGNGDPDEPEGTGGDEEAKNGAADAPVRRTVELDASAPVAIKARPGSRLILTVKTKAGAEVEIDGLGLAAFADPYAPAVFDVILPSEPGKYRVRVPDQTASAEIITDS